MIIITQITENIIIINTKIRNIIIIICRIEKDTYEQKNDIVGNIFKDMREDTKICHTIVVETTIIKEFIILKEIKENPTMEKE